MNDKAEFAVKVLKQYAKENYVLPRSTSDLSKMEEWLILELMKVKKLTIPLVMPSLSNYRECRKSKGLTLREVEDITGISNAYLSQLETGKIKSPSYDVVKKLYDLYNEV